MLSERTTKKSFKLRIQNILQTVSVLKEEDSSIDVNKIISKVKYFIACKTCHCACPRRVLRYISDGDEQMRRNC